MMEQINLHGMTFKKQIHVPGPDGEDKSLYFYKISNDVLVIDNCYFGIYDRTFWQPTQFLDSVLT